MNKRELLIHTFVAMLFMLPLIAFGHGGVDDGHVDGEVVPVTAGASALLKPFSLEWWILLVVSGVLMAGLSYGVWKYLQIPSSAPSQNNGHGTTSKTS